MRAQRPSRQGMAAAALAVACAALPTTAWALRPNASLFCRTYAEAPTCRSGATACVTCHAGAPPALNPFGQDVLKDMSARPDYQGVPADFEAHLAETLATIADRDSDGDGFANADEIARGSEPGDAASRPEDDPARAYRPEAAFRRASLTYCGESPAFAALEAFRRSPQQAESIRALVARCLTSAYWRQQALPRLADARVRPVKALGVEGDPFVIGDYRWDYRLFVHAMTGGRDMRDLLLADYHVRADGTVTREEIPDATIPGRMVIGNGQPLARDKRAGMVTTQWFIASNTMFAQLPRTTAAQAYRAYLGLDLAKSEGLFPVPGEPRDVDRMGVQAPACAVCHATLDPLAYPFSAYTGIAGRRRVGTHDPARTPWESWGFLFGAPVRDVRDWAAKAAASDAFARNVTRMLFRQALGREPSGATEAREFEELWRSLPGDAYSADALIQRLVATTAFGAP